MTQTDQNTIKDKGNKINVALYQMDITSLEIVKNRTKVVDLAEQELKGGADLVVFPELCITGYVEPMVPGLTISGDHSFSSFVEAYHAASEPISGPTITELSKIASKYQGYIVVGLALREGPVEGHLTNSSVLIGPEGVLSVYRKVHLWQNEKHFFEPGRSFPVTKTWFGPLGMQVCYDIRFPEVTRALALGGATIVTNIWASFREDSTPPADPDQFRHRVFTRAQENGVFFLSCNRVGLQNGYRFMGRSVICGPDGQVVGEIANEEEAVLRAELNMDRVAQYRSFVNLANDRRPDVYDGFFGLE
jgi:predicted amidohydrolase